MKRTALLHPPLFLAVVLIFTHASYAQLVAGPGVTDASSSQTASNRTFSFSGTIPGQLDGALTVTFSIYPDQQSASALWTETQIVQVTSEKYSVMLGSTSATGLPPDIFSADQAHWLGVQVNGSEKRFLLVSVPYAMKAVEAERLGGLLPSDYVTVQQLQSALQSAAAPTTSAPTKTTTSGPTGQAAAAGTPPQPATDFTDNNGTEVLLVTQQGPGYAIHAISNLQPAIYAENNASSGTALQIVETSIDGASTGLFAQTLGPGSIAGVFDSAGPAILELRKSGTRMVFFDQFGDMTANGEVRASDFAGSGSGLTNIPNSATTATPSNSNNTIVARDFNGGFVAGTIQATSFVGGGFGLTDIPNSATTATPLNSNNTIVARDFTGAFSGSVITAANFFSGSGAGLTNIPLSAINATSLVVPNTVVARDGSGNFAGGVITAGNFFSGSGSGLTNIPLSAVNATSLVVPNSVVARDGNGNFAGGVITAGNFFSGSGSGLTNIPLSAVNATSLVIPNSVVARDGSGNFAGGVITAGNFFSGSGAGLTNVPLTAINATSLVVPNSVVARDSSGNFAGGFINASGLSASASSGTAIHGDSSDVGVQASTQSGFGLWASASANDSTGTALLISHASNGKLISGGMGSTSNLGQETFSVSATGDVFMNGATMIPYETNGTWFANSLVKLTSIPGTFGGGTVAMTSPGDTAGAVGIITGVPSGTLRIQVATSGSLFCNFDGPATSGNYVGISKTTAGDCTDIGASYPTDGQQVVGRVLSSFVTGTGRVLLFQSELHGGGGSGVTINTGAGLTGGPITGSGTISIANGGVTNTMLQNSSVTVTPGVGLTGGGAVSLGGTITLSNAGALSFNGRTGSVTANSGDYSFSQISGSAASSQLPSTVVYNNQANTFTGNQTVSGAVTATSFSGSGTSLTGVNAATLNGLASGSFAQLAAANSFTAKQTLAASTTTSASLNVPGGAAPATPAVGDVWNTGSTLQYRDNASTTRTLVSTTQSGGLQLLKLTASITPSSVSSQVCTEQSFSVTGISTGDVLLSVLQPSTSSPGTNIAIGGFRVSAANTVAIQFCNVSRNNSTPTAGVYTIALMR